MSIKVITAIAAVFSKMNKCKNFARLFLYVFAIVGVTACSSSGGSSSSPSNQNPLSITLDGVSYPETKNGIIEISNIADTTFTINGGNGDGELSATPSDEAILTASTEPESNSLVLSPVNAQVVADVAVTLTKAGSSGYNSTSITLSFKLKTPQTPLTLSLDSNPVPDYTNIMILTTDANLAYAINGGAGSGACSVVEGVNDTTDAIESTINDDCTELTINPHTIGTETIALVKAGDNTYLEATTLILTITVVGVPKIAQGSLTLSLNNVPLTDSDYTNITIGETDDNRIYTISGGSGSGACSVNEGATDAIESTINDDCTQLTINPHTIGTETITLVKAGNDTYLEAILSITITVVGVPKIAQGPLTLSLNNVPLTESDYTNITIGETDDNRIYTIGGGSGSGGCSVINGTTDAIDGSITTPDNCDELIIDPHTGGTETITLKRAGDDTYLEATLDLTITVKLNQDTLNLSLDANLLTDYDNITIGETDDNRIYTIGGGSGSGGCSVINGATDAIDGSITTPANCDELIIEPHTGGTETITLKRAGDDTYLEATLDITITVKLNQTPLFFGADANTYPEKIIEKTYDTENLEFSETLGGGGGSGIVETTEQRPDDHADDVFQVSVDNGSTFNFTIVGAGEETLTITKNGDGDYAETSIIYTIKVLKGVQTALTLTEENLPAGASFANNELIDLVFNSDETDTNSHATLTLVGGSSSEPFSIESNTITDDGASLMFDEETMLLTIIPNQGAIGYDATENTGVPETFTITKAGGRNYEDTDIMLKVSVKKADAAISVDTSNIVLNEALYSSGDLTGSLTGLVYHPEGVESSQVTLNLLGGAPDTLFEIDTGTEINDGASASLTSPTLIITPDQGAIGYEITEGTGDPEEFIITKLAGINYNASTFSLKVSIRKANSSITVAENSLGSATFADNNDNTGSLIDLIYEGEEATFTLSGGDPNTAFDIMSNETESDGASANITDSDLGINPNEGAIGYSTEGTGAAEIFTITKIEDGNYNAATPYTLSVAVRKANQAALELPPQYYDSNDSSYKVTASSHGTLNIPISGGSSGATLSVSGHDSANLTAVIESNQILQITAVVSSGDEIITLLRTGENHNAVNLTLTVALTSLDSNNNGLIDIWSLEQLSNTRFDLDGSHYKASSTATAINTGCPPAGCVGYELMQDLDFYQDASYNYSSVDSKNDGTETNSAVTTKAVWTPNESVDNDGDPADTPAEGANLGWRPIGTDTAAFTGIFEGNDFTISNLYHKSTTSTHAGLFASINQGTEIQNLSLAAAYVFGKDNIAGLVGSVSFGGSGGSIDNCHITGDSIIEAASNDNNAVAGSITALSRTEISNSSSSAQVTASTATTTYSGGLVGQMAGGSISHSYTTGVVSSSGNSYSYSGGLVGRQNSGTIRHSYTTGAVFVSSTLISSNSYSGGLVGLQDSGGSINHSYATGSVSSSSSSFFSRSFSGGLVGQQNSGTIGHSYATDSVSCSSYYCYSGGLVGYQNIAHISYSYATGSISSSFSSTSYSGGLVGFTASNSISNSYATGSVETTGNSSNEGNLLGNGSAISSCGSGGSADGAVAKLIDLLKSSNDSSGDSTIDDTWQCYDDSGTLVTQGANASIDLFEDWGNYYYDTDDNNKVKSDGNYDSDTDTLVWNFGVDGDTSFLPTLVADPAVDAADALIEQSLQYAHQHVGQWQLLDGNAHVHPLYIETEDSQSFTIPNAEGTVSSFSVTNYSITVNWDTITGDVGDTATYDFTDPDEDTNGSLQYNPDATGDTLTVNEPSSGTQSVFLRGIITIFDSGTSEDTTDDRTWTYNQDFPFQVTK